MQDGFCLTLQIKPVPNLQSIITMNQVQNHKRKRKEKKNIQKDRVTRPLK